MANEQRSTRRSNPEGRGPDASVKVLFAIDHEATKGALEAVFEEEFPQWTVVNVRTSIAAKRLCETRELAAAVVDYDLAGRRGTALLNTLVRLQPRCMRVLVTADVTDMVLRNAVEEGRVHGILPRPIDPAKARHLIARLASGMGALPMNLEEASSITPAPGRDPGQRVEDQVLDLDLPMPLLLRLHAMAAEMATPLDDIVQQALWAKVEHLGAGDQDR